MRSRGGPEKITLRVKALADKPGDLRYWKKRIDSSQMSSDLNINVMTQFSLQKCVSAWTWRQVPPTHQQGGGRQATLFRYFMSWALRQHFIM